MLENVVSFRSFVECIKIGSTPAPTPGTMNCQRDTRRFGAGGRRAPPDRLAGGDAVANSTADRTACETHAKTSRCSRTQWPLGQESPGKAPLLRPGGPTIARAKRAVATLGSTSRKIYSLAGRPAVCRDGLIGPRPVQCIPDRQRAGPRRRRHHTAIVCRLLRHVQDPGRRVRRRIALVDDLAADDFQSLRASFAKRWGVHRVSGEVQRVRTLFKYGYDAGLIDKPMRFGPTFKRPAARIMRAHRQKNGPANVRGRGTADDHRGGAHAAQGDDSAGHQLRVRQSRLRHASAVGPGPESRLGRTTRGRRLRSSDAARCGRKQSRRSRDAIDARPKAEDARARRLGVHHSIRSAVGEGDCRSAR